ncbi:MAG: methylmalonyl Co-A mutase-associated GTPase MeaB [Deltaproteobacteria bacterium]|nr:MAG: methylmalonyl Co-A mutase-associated GTPase MeaB [Deltaproteobacteria bacterium]
MEFMNLIEEAMSGSVRSLGKLISLVENEAEDMQKVLKAIYPQTGNALVIGITGPPGVGKSTLVSWLAKKYREKKHSVGILAIDPSSPISGGSLLGDRIRMSHLSPSDDIYIRSLSSRGALGGISQATLNIVRILDATGRDTIIIETVGVGQDEVEVINVADTSILVLSPGFGDEIQALKAGIMEVADIFVVNKADQPDALKYVHTLEKMIQSISSYQSWVPPVIKTIALQGEGVKELMEKIEAHQSFIKNDKSYLLQKKEKLRREVIRLAEQKISRELDHFLREKIDFDNILEEVASGRKDPYYLAEEMVRFFLKTRSEATKI